VSTYATLVSLRIDHPHARRRHDDVIDVGAAAWNTTIVKHDSTVLAQAVQASAELPFALCSTLPGGRRLRIALHRRKKSSDAWMSLLHVGTTSFTTSFELPLR
jgi:hypothetical protein